MTTFTFGQPLVLVASALAAATPGGTFQRKVGQHILLRCEGSYVGCAIVCAVLGRAADAKAIILTVVPGLQHGNDLGGIKVDRNRQVCGRGETRVAVLVVTVVDQ